MFAHGEGAAKGDDRGDNRIAILIPRQQDRRPGLPGWSRACGPVRASSSACGAATSAMRWLRRRNRAI